MDALCPVHQKQFKWVEAGVSKKTGKPYQGFWSCPEFGCQMKPNQPVGVMATGTPIYKPTEINDFRPGKAPEKMTREDWEAKEARTNRNILLQVAFKAAVELAIAHMAQFKTLVEHKVIFANTSNLHNWLLSQTEGMAGNDVDKVNRLIDDARLEQSDDVPPVFS